MYLKNKIEITKHILSSNPIIVKRKLNIYNFINETNYRLEDFGIRIDYKTVFFFNKMVNYRFNYDKLDDYKKRYNEVIKWFIKELENSVVKNKAALSPNGISSTNFLFSIDGKFILYYDLRKKEVFINNYIISSVFYKRIYNWEESVGICKDVLDKYFGNWITSYEILYTLSWEPCTYEEDFRNNCI